MTEEKLAPIPPGEILLEEFIRPSGLSLNETARRMHIPPGRLSEICNTRRVITAETALRLSKFYGMSPEFWLSLQREYDMKAALQKIGRELDFIVPLVKDEGR